MISQYYVPPDTGDSVVIYIDFLDPERSPVTAEVLVVVVVRF